MTAPSEPNKNTLMAPSSPAGDATLPGVSEVDPKRQATLPQQSLAEAQPLDVPRPMGDGPMGDVPNEKVDAKQIDKAVDQPVAVIQSTPAQSDAKTQPTGMSTESNTTSVEALEPVTAQAHTATTESFESPASPGTSDAEAGEAIPAGSDTPAGHDLAIDVATATEVPEPNADDVSDHLSPPEGLSNKSPVVVSAENVPEPDTHVEVETQANTPDVETPIATPVAEARPVERKVPPAPLEAALHSPVKVEATKQSREIQFAMFGKHPSHDDYYLFNDTGSDEALAWFESSIARQLRDAHPGDKSGCHDRWILWVGKAQTLIAAAWDSRDSRGRARTPLFTCIAVDQQAGMPFVEESVAFFLRLRTKLFGKDLLDRNQFLAAVRAESVALQTLKISLDTLNTENGHALRRANDILRAVGLEDLSAAAALFPRAGLGAKLKRASRMLRAISVKSSPDAPVKDPCLDRHCRVHQQGLSAAESLDGWAALVEMTGQSGPLGVIISESGIVDLYASKPETVSLAGVYEE